MKGSDFLSGSRAWFEYSGNQGQPPPLCPVDMERPQTHGTVASSTVNIGKKTIIWIDIILRILVEYI